MEFLAQSFINTTTAIVVNSNTTTAKFIMNRSNIFQYVSSGFNNDATTATLRINFGSTLSVSRIALTGHNLKDFTVFYNGVTANTFVLTSTGMTTASDFSTNSLTSMYMSATPVDCTSVSIDMQGTMIADSEKAVGYLALTAVDLDFPRIPRAGNYTPSFNPKDVTHKLSDGGTRIQTLGNTWQTNIGFENITTSFRDNLRTIFDDHKEFIFVPFGTLASDDSWDKIIFPCVWRGPFDFYNHSDNATEAGFSGKIQLLETPR